MSDDAVRQLAAEAGIALQWRDVHGQEQQTGMDALRAILGALGLDSGGASAIAESRRLLALESGLPPLCTTDLGRPVLLRRVEDPAPRFRIVMEQGGAIEGRAEAEGDVYRLCVVDRPGYHRLTLGDQDTVLAVAPARGTSPGDLAPGRRPWGLAAQLYGLRRGGPEEVGNDGGPGTGELGAAGALGDGGLGDFTALSELAVAAARRGADALAISPVHAQFSADPDRFSPYAPSSRIFLNVLHADPAALGLPALRDALEATGAAAEYARLQSLELIDWPAAARLRLRLFRALFDRLPDGSPVRAELRCFRAGGGEALERHARFEALHAHLYAADPSLWDWRSWPGEYRDPAGPGVARFAQDHAREVDFHVFLQWLAASGLSGAQAAMRRAGAGIGLIADLAVGTDGGGSHGWSRQGDILPGLTVGAPPDIFSPLGQNWGIAAFSPRGLKAGGYGAFLEMLRAAMRHAGGVRIDHAMGLARLWLVPPGGSARDGAYLHFPQDDLLRLVALESHRNRAVVIGEDLGTLPQGFRERLDGIGMMGLRVLWFEQDRQRRFLPPRDWSPGAVAVTSTHDLPTVAGWWRGQDIAWRARLGLLGEGSDGAAEYAERAADREELWRAMRDSGAAQGDPPPPEAGGRVADAAAAHVGGAACALALLPLEDALALVEQPNLPGTTDQHPNWRRRLPGAAATLLNDPDCAARLDAFSGARTDGVRS